MLPVFYQGIKKVFLYLSVVIIVVLTMLVIGFLYATGVY
jgi:hypothetical protein